MEQGELNHISFIPDGNNRWAKVNERETWYAYRQGAERAKEAIEEANNHGIHTVTFWGLSTENWRHRPPQELQFLSGLFMDLADHYLDDANQNGVRVTHLGRKDRLPPELLERVAEVERVTAHNTGHVLNLALDYGGQDEVIRATRQMIEDTVNGKLDPQTLDDPIGGSEEAVQRTVFSEYLDTGGQSHPFPDFIVRTSGEMRLSGFMPMQGVYAELYFAPCLWPDFDADEFQQAVEVFYTRQRRFGGGH